MAADHGVIIIIAVRHKITNKTAGVVLRGHGGLQSHSGRDRIRYLAEKSKGNESAVYIGLLLLLTLAKTACANKVADFTAPFMKNVASK